MDVNTFVSEDRVKPTISSYLSVPSQIEIVLYTVSESGTNRILSIIR
jgi:hypothetical protein